MLKHSLCRKINLLFALLTLSLAAATGQAQTISRAILAPVLKDGGFVIVMRHASSPNPLPDAATANPDNVKRERQLDATGRADAIAMGTSLRRLGIPIEQVLSSPTYRAIETAHLLGFENVQAVDELGNEDMQATGAEKADWLRQQMKQKTRKGNRLLITHGPNIAAAFPEYSVDMTEGEALIFDPRGMDGPVMIQRIKIGDWNDL